MQFRFLAQSHLYQDIQLAVAKLVVERRLDAGPGAVGMAIELAALHGEIDLAGAVVALDDLEARAEQRIVERGSDHCR